MLFMTLLACFSQPLSGDYDLTWEDAWAGNCGIMMDEIGIPEDGYVELDFDGDDFTWSESDLTLNCSHTDPDFTCDSYEEFEDYTQDGLDALLGFSFTYEGEFDSNTTLDGTAMFDLSCGGSDCASLASGLELNEGFPCSMTLDFEGEL